MTDTPAQSVEKEIIQLAGGDLSLDAAAQKLGMTRGGKVHIEPLHDWQRGGGETYIIPFKLSEVTANGETETNSFMLKACVKMFPEKAVGRWMERRELFEKNGLGASRAYGAGNGVVLEEFVPHSVEDVLKKGGPEARDMMWRVKTYYHKVAKLGFKPTSLLYNLRCTEQGEIRNVDFGEDLGAPSAESTRLAKLFRSDVDRVFESVRPKKEEPAAATAGLTLQPLFT